MNSISCKCVTSELLESLQCELVNLQSDWVLCETFHVKCLPGCHPDITDALGNETRTIAMCNRLSLNTFLFLYLIFILLVFSKNHKPSISAKGELKRKQKWMKPGLIAGLKIASDRFWRCKPFLGGCLRRVCLYIVWFFGKTY